MLSVVSEQRDDAIVLAPEGEMDMHSTRTLREALEVVLSDGREAVVMNLAGVSFMDSTGLALMLNAARRLTRHKRPFAIACPDGPIRKAFHVSGMEDFFVIRPALEDALADAQPAFSRWPVA